MTLSEKKQTASELLAGLSPREIDWLEADNALFWAKRSITSIDGQPFSLQDYPFLKQIYQDESQEIYIEKCAQIGATVYAISKFIHEVGVRGRNGIYYFPTDKAVSHFVQSRFNRLRDDNPKIAALIPDTDNTGVKRIGKGFGHFFGLKGKAQKLSTPADILVVDELDAVEGEANVELAEERLGASKINKKIYLSTPTIPNYGIDRKYIQTDQMHWIMKCEKCGKDNIAEEMTFPDCVEQGFLACNKCLLEINTRIGRWVPKYQDRKIRGYHINKLIWPLANYAEIANKYKRAISLQTFFNSTLGLPYIDSESGLSAVQILDLCCNDQMGQSETDSCTAGIDVGKLFHVVISKRDTRRLRKVVYIGTVSNYDELDNLLKRFNVKKFCIDAMPELHGARSFVKRNSWAFKGWVARYVESAHQAKWNEETREVQVNRTESLDASQTLLRNKLVFLPRRSDTVEEFAAHCEDIARTQEVDEDTKEVTYKWISKSGIDHYRHAFNYDALNWFTTGDFVIPKGTMHIPEKTGFKTFASAKELR